MVFANLNSSDIRGGKNIVPTSKTLKKKSFVFCCIFFYYLMTPNLFVMSATLRDTIKEKRRPVFKYALDKPRIAPWPEVSAELQRDIVDKLCVALQPLKEYFIESRKKKTKKQGGFEHVGKELLSHIVLGVNSNTRALEKQAKGNSSANVSISLVIVCRTDVEPQMTAHFPALAHIAAYQSASNKGDDGIGLRLIDVDKGSEQKLASAVGQNRVSVIGIRASAPPPFKAIMERACTEIKPPMVSWIGSAEFHPVSVRELHTTAPIVHKKATKTRKRQLKQAKKKVGREGMASPNENQNLVH